MEANSKMIECITFYGETKSLPEERLSFRPAVYGLIVDQGRLLLVTNRNNGKYTLPGGGVEIGESMVEALKREVREETGIAVEVGNFLEFYERFFYYDPEDLAFHGLFLVVFWLISRYFSKGLLRCYDREGSMASILVIDDSAEIRDLVCRVMVSEGHDVREALNGEEGVALYKEARPDLVFTDLFMPRKNGIETITDLYDFDETVNVIAMTSHGGEENYDFLRVARALGAVNTLQKPFKIDDLKKAAETALKG